MAWKPPAELQNMVQANLTLWKHERDSVDVFGGLTVLAPGGNDCISQGDLRQLSQYLQIGGCQDSVWWSVTLREETDPGQSHNLYYRIEPVRYQPTFVTQPQQPKTRDICISGILGGGHACRSVISRCIHVSLYFGQDWTAQPKEEPPHLPPSCGTSYKGETINVMQAVFRPVHNLPFVPLCYHLRARITKSQP